METKDGLHIWEDHFFPEIIDPETGQIMEDGELGELVLTTLSKEALPMIRYRTRDLTRLLPGTARSMRRIEKVTGRSDDMIILRGVNIFPTQIEEIVLQTPEIAPHFQIHLSNDGPLDKMKVLVETLKETNNEKLVTSIKQKVLQKVKDTIGVSIDIAVGLPGAVERSQGKAQRVIDLRTKKIENVFCFNNVS